MDQIDEMFAAWMQDRNADVRTTLTQEWMRAVAAAAYEGGFLAALSLAEKSLPGETVSMWNTSKDQATGWNRCLSEVSERLAALKATKDTP